MMKIKWDIEHVYFYIVCFVALILIIIGAVTLTKTVIAYVVPVYEDYNPFSQSWQNQDIIMWEEHFGEGFITAEKERFESIAAGNYSRGLIRDLISGLAFIGAALPVYLYHWRKIQALERATAG